MPAAAFELDPATGKMRPVRMTESQLAKLEADWQANYNERCEPRFMEQMRHGSPAQKARLLALMAQ